MIESRWTLLLVIDLIGSKRCQEDEDSRTDSSWDKNEKPCEWYVSDSWSWPYVYDFGAV